MNSPHFMFNFMEGKLMFHILTLGQCKTIDFIESQQISDQAMCPHSQIVHRILPSRKARKFKTGVGGHCRNEVRYLSNLHTYLFLRFLTSVDQIFIHQKRGKGYYAVFYLLNNIFILISIQDNVTSWFCKLQVLVVLFFLCFLSHAPDYFHFSRMLLFFFGPTRQIVCSR